MPSSPEPKPSSPESNNKEVREEPFPLQHIQCGATAKVEKIQVSGNTKSGLKLKILDNT